MPKKLTLTEFSLSIFEVEQSTQRVNATKICQAFNKDINQWLRLPNTKKLFKSFERMNPLCENYISTIKGGNGEQGTWINRKLAIELARWLNSDFAMYTLDKLDSLFQTGKVELRSTPKPLTVEELLEMNNNAINSLRAKVQEQEKKLEAQAPVVSFVEDTYVKNNIGLSPMKTVAHEVGMKIVPFYKLLRDNKIWFYHLNEHGKNENAVMAKYIASGHFVVKQFYSEQFGQSFDKIYATPKGKLLCHRLVNREHSSQPALTSAKSSQVQETEEYHQQFQIQHCKGILTAMQKNTTRQAKFLLEVLQDTAVELGCTILEVVMMIRQSLAKYLA